MKNKKLIFALIALVAVVAIMAGIWFATRPRPQKDDGETQGQTNASTAASNGTDTSSEPEFEKNFTVIVVHADGSEKTFTYGTNDDYLGPVLVEKGLIVESNSPGLYNTVDGETADWNVDQSYWSFYIGNEMASYGMDDAVIHDGDVFKLVYTK